MVYAQTWYDDVIIKKALSLKADGCILTFIRSQYNRAFFMLWTMQTMWSFDYANKAPWNKWPLHTITFMQNSPIHSHWLCNSADSRCANLNRISRSIRSDLIQSNLPLFECCVMSEMYLTERRLKIYHWYIIWVGYPLHWGRGLKFAYRPTCHSRVLFIIVCVTMVVGVFWFGSLSLYLGHWRTWMPLDIAPFLLSLWP